MFSLFPPFILLDVELKAKFWCLLTLRDLNNQLQLALILFNQDIEIKLAQMKMLLHLSSCWELLKKFQLFFRMKCFLSLKISLSLILNAPLDDIWCSSIKYQRSKQFNYKMSLGRICFYISALQKNKQERPKTMFVDKFKVNIRSHKITGIQGMMLH